MSEYSGKGGGWKKTFKKDGKEQEYISCSANIDESMIKNGKISFALFPNDKKVSDSSPDYNVKVTKKND